MKILLTGLPKSGKATLLTDLIEGIYPKRGMVTEEEVDEGRRVGFNLLDEQNNITTLAHTDKSSNYPVGRFFVDVISLDNFLDQFSSFTSDDLLYIDEAGQMQLYSERFKQ